MDEHKIEEVAFIYWGTGDLSAYGIRHRKALFQFDLQPEIPNYVPQPGDVVAVSVTSLQMGEGPAMEFLRTRLEPFDKAGDSIFLYRLPARISDPR
jgi:hypothetical protein